MDLSTGALEAILDVALEIDSLELQLNHRLIVRIMAKDLSRVMTTSFLLKALKKIENLTGDTKIKDLAIVIMITSLETTLKVKVSAISSKAVEALLDNRKEITIPMKVMPQEVVGLAVVMAKSITEDSQRQANLEIRVTVFRETKDTKAPRTNPNLDGAMVLVESGSGSMKLWTIISQYITGL